MKKYFLEIISIIGMLIISLSFNPILIVFMIWSFFPVILFYFGTRKHFKNWQEMKTPSKICLMLLSLFLLLFPVLISLMWVFDFGNFASNAETSALIFIFMPLLALIFSITPFIFLYYLERKKI